MDLDRDAYLARVGLESAPSPTEEGLKVLHRAQTLAIPFENFDIHLGRGVSLAPDVLVDKLVNSRRGGYCFELNSLFGMALDSFGFQRREVLARVHLQGTPTGRSHLFNLVHLNGRDWLADPGFGFRQLLDPVPLEIGRIETQVGNKYRLVDGGAFGTMVQLFEKDAWRNWLSFDMETVCAADKEMGNYFTSTSPTTIFTQARVAIRTVPSGSVTLMDFLLRRFADGSKSETELEPGPSYLDALEENFGISIDAPYEALRPVGADTHAN